MQLVHHSYLWTPQQYILWLKYVLNRKSWQNYIRIHFITRIHCISTDGQERVKAQASTIGSMLQLHATVKSLTRALSVGQCSLCNIVQLKWVLKKHVPNAVICKCIVALISDYTRGMQLKSKETLATKPNSTSPKEGRWSKKGKDKVTPLLTTCLYMPCLEEQPWKIQMNNWIICFCPLYSDSKWSASGETESRYPYRIVIK